MSGFVLDASAGLSLLLRSQATPASLAFAAQLPMPIITPSIFQLEVRYALLRFERRGQIPTGSLDAVLADLEAYIAEFAPHDPHETAILMQTARFHQIGLFDALYLELAEQRGAILVSRDARLLDAARARGLDHLDLR
jgi:predicted nucleic acid-binding protein